MFDVDRKKELSEIGDESGELTTSPDTVPTDRECRWLIAISRGKFLRPADPDCNSNYFHDADHDRDWARERRLDPSSRQYSFNRWPEA